MPIEQIDPKMQAQLDEFVALRRLSKAFSNLPPIVEPGYTDLYQIYERELTNFLHALRQNGRI
jgi:hypothetical protein